MKKIELVLFLVLVLFASCGERYEEVRNSTFEGTWTLLESYVDTVKVPITGGKFLTAREFEGENLLLFYSGGNYDSSFFFRIQDNNLFVRRVLDSVDVIYRYYEKDSTGNYVLDESGKKIMKADTVKKSQKPLNPQTNYSPEKYYGTYSFESGAQLTLTLNRYQVNESGAPTTELQRKDIYSRPLEKE
ncbi:MAG: hypothetical protein LBI60_07135 [Bacteroidales bacterium]|jgi:hypothetical protein|nr:hypothetical protein [Bacteroidales bacterium]